MLECGEAIPALISFWNNINHFKRLRMKFYENKQEKKKQIQEQKRRQDQRKQKRNWS